MSATHWPILDFAKFTCGKGPDGGLAMLVAYFDESGTHGDSRLVSVAGLLGTSVEWSRLELPWKKRLGAIPWFHATDCEHQQGHFKDLTKGQCALLSGSLSELVAQRRLVAIGGSVYRDDWEYGASPRMKMEFGNDPYYFCFAMAIAQAAKWSQSNENSEAVSFVFAAHEQYGEYSKQVFSRFAESVFRHNIGSHAVTKPRCLIQLQAADLYAYENYRELLFQLENHGHGAPARENLKIIARNLHIESRFFDINGLHSFADQLLTMGE